MKRLLVFSIFTVLMIPGTAVAQEPVTTADGATVPPPIDEEGPPPPPESSSGCKFWSFSNIPPTFTPVDAFGDMFPGVTLISDNLWIANSLTSCKFERMWGRAISTSTGGALTVMFDMPKKEVEFDLGSGKLGMPRGLHLTGYLNGDVVFQDTIYTVHGTGCSCPSVPWGCADEIHIEIPGTIDSFEALPTYAGGGASTIIDNLSFCGADLDTDADGVLDPNDLCPDTIMPESVPANSLGINRWALVDDDGVFDTTPPPGGGNGPDFEFTVEDTRGCSCEQIIEAWALGWGHTKFGCSTGVILQWMAAVWNYEMAQPEKESQANTGGLKTLDGSVDGSTASGTNSTNDSEAERSPVLPRRQAPRRDKS